MEIIEAKNSGFCFGVRAAVKTALDNASPNTYAYGDIIHNETVLNRLKAKGVQTVENIDDIPCGATVIIRSHGVKKAVYDQIKSRGLTLIDATCPFVRKIHEIVNSHYNDGYKIYIIGNPAHPEVIGINGWCNDEGVVVDEKFDFQSLDSEQKACFVTQTTFSIEKYEQILKKIPKDRLKTVEIFDTICYTTVSRQNEARSLALKCSKVLVVGSKKSSNTKKLVELSSSGSCTAFAVSSLDELKKIKFSTEDIVGIIAGASTPDESITEVKKYMAEQFTDAQNAEFLAAIEKDFVEYKVGKRITGKVISADEKGIKLQIGGKNDGFIPAADVTLDGSYNPADYTEGMELDVKIGKKDNDTGCILLSKKAVDEIKEADKVVETI
ncbi:MAG: 4-hydroxy-3-methylbut-2-enyl diphosphate reductase, partial [Clostridia bacterium]|nr:4-hydroxy-3-methylbut-2-enyl diphosphate reductase [Clostridia bacterium]